MRIHRPYFDNITALKYQLSQPKSELECKKAEDKFSQDIEIESVGQTFLRMILWSQAQIWWELWGRVVTLMTLLDIVIRFLWY